MLRLLAKAKPIDRSMAVLVVCCQFVLPFTHRQNLLQKCKKIQHKSALATKARKQDGRLQEMFF